MSKIHVTVIIGLLTFAGLTYAYVDNNFLDHGCEEVDTSKPRDSGGCRYHEIWEATLDAEYLFVNYSIAEPTTSAYVYAVDSHEPTEESRWWFGPSVPGERRLVLAAFGPGESRVLASIRADAEIAPLTAQIGETLQFPLEEVEAILHPEGGPEQMETDEVYARNDQGERDSEHEVEPDFPQDGWERVTWRLEVVLEKPFYAFLMKGGKEIAETFEASTQDVEHRFHSSGAFSWQDAEKNLTSGPGFSGSAGTWVFQVETARAGGIKTNVSVGILLDPPFMSETESGSVPIPAPDFSVYPLDDRVSLYPGGDRQLGLSGKLGPLYRPLDELVVARTSY